MLLISDESKQRARSPLNIDNFAQRYVTTNGYYTFTSPSMWTIEKNLYLLLKDSTVQKFDAQYKYKPSYLSFDQYGTVILEQLLMYVNNVFCIEDFDLSTVVIPTLNSIINICQDKFPPQSLENLETVTW